MDSKHTSQKSKPRLLKMLLTFLLSIAAVIILYQPITVHASGTSGINYSGWASSLCHSTGDGNQGGTATIQNGVSYTRTGYLAYLLTVDGQKVPGTNAVAFTSPGYNEIPGADFYCTSRKGGYTATGFNGGTAPWNCTPWTEGGASTNEPQIKAWFEGMDANGVQNGVDFVDKTWGRENVLKFISGDYIIVVETLMHFQYSTASNSLSSGEIGALAASIIREAYETPANGPSLLLQAAQSWGWEISGLTSNEAYSLLPIIKQNLRTALEIELRETIGGSSRIFVGNPVIGTVPNLLNYKTQIALTTNPFKSYTNKVAPFAERAIADGVAERAGFQVWTGSTSSEISDQEVKDFGLAMMIITATDPLGQTTCDEPLQPTPHPAPDESIGTTTIIKNYRTYNITTGTYTDDGKYKKESVASNIIIEDETDYLVVAWKTSSSTALIDSVPWSVPGTITRSGTSTGLVELTGANEKTLYVLLEKTEVTPNPPEPWDFCLEQSQITKRVTFTESATTSTLLTHIFKWTAPAPSITSCQSHGGNGHHLNCSTVWDEEPRAASGTPGTPGYDAGSSGVAHSHGNSCYDTPCTSWKWTDNTTQLGITLDTSTINKAVVSKNWSVTYNATTVNTITTSNKYYKENTSTRSGTGANTQSLSQFNFITVLFRGQDHLTLADWKNGGPVSYLTSLAYDSAYNFKSANTPQGTRKSGTEYTETFATKFVGKYTGNHQTTYGATVGAYGKCSTTSTYSFNDSSAYTIPNIKVNIQVFWAQGVSPSASGTSPSTQTAGKAIFYPYIRMRYDSNVLTDSKVYVLGENRRTVTFYDYATVYITGGDPSLTINSNQWSTHSDAMSNILSEFSGRTLSTTEENRVKSSVLPGGATLSIAAHSNDTRKIFVKTIQAYLTGSGKTQVDNTGGGLISTLPTDRTQLESIHTSLVSSVSGVASQAYIAQYICTGAKLNSSEMTGAQFVQPGQEFTGNGTRFSTDSKYHFNSYTDSKLNTHVNSPSYSTYTFYTDTMGNIRCSKNNTSPSETSGTIIAPKGVDTVTGGDSTMREIATKTGVIFFIKITTIHHKKSSHM